MAFSYRQIKDLYDTLHDAGATSVSLPEWSDEMNRLTGTDLYGEGRNDNILKRASVGIDRLLEMTGLPDVTREFGRGVGGLVGNPEAGAEIGSTLPRQLVNFLPMLIPGAGWARAAQLGGTALLSGIDAYTSSGSPAAGVVTGLTNAALPKGTDLAEQFILKKLGARLEQGAITKEFAQSAGGNIDRLVTEQVKRYYPESFGQKAGAFVGGQAAASLALEGERWGQEGFSGEPLHNPFTTENLLNLTLGQVPFAVTHGISKLAGAKGPREQAEAMRQQIEITEQRVALKRAQDAMRERTDIENVPVIEATPTPEVAAQIQERLQALREKQASIVSKPEPTPEDAEALSAAIAADDATPKRATPTSALGVEQRGDYIPLVGKQLHETAKWRKIAVADDPANPEEFRGKVIEYSKGLREPAPIPMGEDSDLTTFSVTADPLWRTTKTAEEEAARQAKYATARQRPETAPTPELPEQARPAASLFDHISDLDRIEVDVDAAKTPAQLQKAIIELRRLQESVGLSEFSDTQFQRVMRKLVEKGEKTDVTK